MLSSSRSIKCPAGRSLMSSIKFQKLLRPRSQTVMPRAQFDPFRPTTKIYLCCSTGREFVLKGRNPQSLAFHRAIKCRCPNGVAPSQKVDCL